jgi:hypothetical protein
MQPRRFGQSLSPAQYNVNSSQDKIRFRTRQLACTFSEQRLVEGN